MTQWHNSKIDPSKYLSSVPCSRLQLNTYQAWQHLYSLSKKQIFLSFLHYTSQYLWVHEYIHETYVLLVSYLTKYVISFAKEREK